MNDVAAFRFLSLGAGIQSTAIALLSVDGHLPRIEHAIFADTGWEPRAVYEHLDRLEPVLVDAGIELHRVRKGNMRADALDPTVYSAAMPLHVQGEPWTCEHCDGRGEVLDPYWTLGDDPDAAYSICEHCGGSGGYDGVGMIRRQCTQNYKLDPIMARVRRLLGAPVEEIDGRVRVGRVPGRPGANWAENWVGISTDEIGRVKPSKVQYVRRVDPLIDIVSMSRADCKAYLRDRWPFPVARSACIGCPFHSNAEWRDLRDNSPDEWADAVQFDHDMRHGNSYMQKSFDSGLLRGKAYLHGDRVPLDEVDLDRRRRGDPDPAQIALFGDDDFGCNPFGCERGDP